MELRKAFGEALRRQRRARGLSQEAFTNVSGRTYLSELERGLKSPTLDTIEKLAATMGLHPLSLLAECFALKDDAKVEDVCFKVERELQNLKKS